MFCISYIQIRGTVGWAHATKIGRLGLIPWLVILEDFSNGTSGLSRLLHAQCCLLTRHQCSIHCESILVAPGGRCYPRHSQSSIRTGTIKLSLSRYKMKIKFSKAKHLISIMVASSYALLHRRKRFCWRLMQLWLFFHLVSTSICFCSNWNFIYRCYSQINCK